MTDRNSFSARIHGMIGPTVRRNFGSLRWSLRQVVERAERGIACGESGFRRAYLLIVSS